MHQNAENTKSKYIDEFETEGIDSMNLIGKKVHLRRDLRTSVKGGDHDLATWYLWSVDLEVYSKANINASSISGYVREMDKGDDPLPEGSRITSIFQRCSVSGH